MHISSTPHSIPSPSISAQETSATRFENAERDVRSKPDSATGRPAGDHRSADRIIDDNPILKRLGHQKDINRELAYQRLGDWTASNPNPDARADAAFNAARVLNYIDASMSATGEDRQQASGNGDLEGITSSGDARHGTPAGMWKDFTEQGYSALRADHRLDTTSDSHVTPHGTNKDNLQWAAGEAGKKLWFIPGLSNVLLEIEKSEAGLAPAIAGAKAGFDKTMNDGLSQAISGVVTGDLRAVLRGGADVVRKNEATPASVKALLDVASDFSV
ncbi:hypothetical protein [Pseudomonas syringae]|uniref:hypothetical protein n=1 Tax=Pseudomonas syringae TaxID=317 RepID=UPI001F3BE175|nr:hypothetical protein [Pseudomonas syringae]MCF5723053.1 hypothetical protein [Pseudomonas syringae]